jgi:hypothetical protein
LLVEEDGKLPLRQKKKLYAGILIFSAKSLVWYQTTGQTLRLMPEQKLPVKIQQQSCSHGAHYRRSGYSRILSFPTRFADLNYYFSSRGLLFFTLPTLLSHHIINIMTSTIVLKLFLSSCFL